MYKGEVIAEGSCGDIYKALDDIFTRSFKSSLAEVLDEIPDLEKIDAAIKELKIKGIPVNTLSPLQAQRRLKDIIKTYQKIKGLFLIRKKMP